jgi:WhiB family redox-sensing transcriptional regulator
MTRDWSRRVSLHEAGKTDNEIAETLGATSSAIRKWRAVRGLEPNNTTPRQNAIQFSMGADWRNEAACIDVDTDIFFPETGNTATYRHALMICRACPVAGSCLEDALATETREGQRHGMRGGLTPDQRRSLARSKERQRARINATARGTA